MAANGIQSIDTVYVLHYTETTGYNHNTWDESLEMFEDLADSLSTGNEQWIIVQDGNGNEFNSLANLQKYRIVIFSNTSGCNGLNSTQRQNFEQYIGTGGSYLGIHAATDTYRHSTANGNCTGVWDWYAENVAGASVQQSPNHTSSSHVDSIFIWNTLYAAGLPYIWIKKEEFYYWQNGYLNSSDFIEVARTGRTGGNSYDAPRMLAHYRDLPGGGRAFYTSMGHSASNFTNSESPSDEFFFFRVMMLNVLENTSAPTVFGIEEEEVTPEVVKLEDGFFYLSEEPAQKTCYIYSLIGQHVKTVTIMDRKVPMHLHPGIWIYKVPGGPVWKAGTISQ